MSFFLHHLNRLHCLPWEPIFDGDNRIVVVVVVVPAADNLER